MPQGSHPRSPPTRTDRNGRFTFSDVPAGTHTVSFWAPWLDSIAVPAIRRQVEVRGSGTVTADLATPSRRTFQLVLCGVELEPEQSILIGEIRGPDFIPLPDVGVNARWNETILGTGVFERQLVASAETSDAAGMYALCGLPTGSEVALRAIGMAAVAISGDSTATVRTREDGGFTLEGVPRRSLQLIARAVGFVPRLTDVQATDADVELEDITLHRVPPELEAVIVEGRQITAAQLEFDVRRQRGMGSYITDEQMERLPMPTVSAISSMLPRTRAVGSGSKTMLMLQRQSFGGGQISTTCNPRFFVDGYGNGYLDAEEPEWLIRRAKRMEVYTAQTAPSRYNDFGGCGVVIIWTR